MRVRDRQAPWSSIRVVGVGSPHGDDRAGWLVVERLGPVPGDRATSLGVEARAIADPLRLVELVDTGVFLVVVDACRSGRRLGHLARATWGALRQEAAGDPRVASSHGLGVFSALSLAEALGRLTDPGAVLILGVEVGPSPDALSPAAEVSTAVQLGVERACRLIRALAARLDRPVRPRDPRPRPPREGPRHENGFPVGPPGLSA